jgi:hypothetical protein
VQNYSSCNNRSQITSLEKCVHFDSVCNVKSGNLSFHVGYAVLMFVDCEHNVVQRMVLWFLTTCRIMLVSEFPSGQYPCSIPIQSSPFRPKTNSPSTWTKFRSSEAYELTYRPAPYKNTEDYLLNSTLPENLKIHVVFLLLVYLVTFGMIAPHLVTFGMIAPHLVTFGMNAPHLVTFGMTAPHLVTFGMIAPHLYFLPTKRLTSELLKQGISSEANSPPPPQCLLLFLWTSWFSFLVVAIVYPTYEDGTPMRRSYVAPMMWVVICIWWWGTEMDP